MEHKGDDKHVWDDPRLRTGIVLGGGVLLLLSCAVVSCSRSTAQETAEEKASELLGAGMPEKEQPAGDLVAPPVDPSPGTATIDQAAEQPASAATTTTLSDPADNRGLEALPAPAAQPVEGVSQETTYTLPDITVLPETPLDLPDALSRALSANLDVQVKTIDRDIATSVHRQARGAFNPVFKAEADYEDVHHPQNTQEFVSTGGDLLLLSKEPRIFEENNFRAKVSIEGKLPTGTEYELFSREGVLENTLNRTSPLSLFTPEYESFTGITLTQPLIKNFGTNVNLAEIRIARKNKVISELELRAAMLDTVSETLQAYFDLSYQVEEMKLKEEERQLAFKLVGEKRELLEKGQVSPRELNRMESALAEVIEDLTLSRNKVFERQTKLQSLLSAGQIQPGKFTIYRPTSAVPVPVFHLEINSLLGEAYANRPEYLIAQQGAERDAIRLVYARNQTWPQLDIKATLGRNGLDDNLGSSYARAYDSHGSEWSVGAVFSFPLWNDAALGKRDEAEHRKEQSIVKLKQIEINTSLMVQQLLAVIDSNYQRLDAMRLFHDNAARALGQEEVRLEKGLTTELELLKFRRDLNQAKVRETAALVDLNKAYVKLFQTTGTLLEKYNIQVGAPVQE
jgi:outer membrane protein TolC